MIFVAVVGGVGSVQTARKLLVRMRLDAERRAHRKQLEEEGQLEFAIE